MYTEHVKVKYKWYKCWRKVGAHKREKKKLRLKQTVKTWYLSSLYTQTCIYAYMCVRVCVCVCVCAHVSLGCILTQLLMPHEKLLSLPECLADGEALVNSLDVGGRNVLDGCYGQSAVLQHELSHLAVPSQQSIVQRRVPARQKYHLYSVCVCLLSPPLCPWPHLSSVCSMWLGNAL